MREPGDLDDTATSRPDPFDALASFARRHGTDLRRFARSLARDDERAGDLVQHALTKTVVALDRGTEINDLPAWLRRCIYNAHINQLRREPPMSLEMLDQEPSTSASLAELADSRERLRAVDTLLDAMPTHYRAAFVLAELHGLGCADIAHTMNRSARSIARILYYARRRVRAELGELA